MTASPQLPLQWTEEALAAARSGDKDAFTGLVSPLTANLRRLARRLTRNQEDAEDVCQESILKAFTKLAQFTETQEVASDDFRKWLTKITVNSAIDFNRRKRASRIVALEECDFSHRISYRTSDASRSENPEGSYARKERVCIVVNAIAKLPRRLRNVCLLRNMMDLSTKEVAAQLGISTNAVRLRLFRAHGQLRKNLGGVTFERRRQYRRTAQSTTAM
jgi:RNA polymerase sigma factor (sigma-70 family)